MGFVEQLKKAARGVFGDNFALKGEDLKNFINSVESDPRFMDELSKNHFLGTTEFLTPQGLDEVLSSKTLSLSEDKKKDIRRKYVNSMPDDIGKNVRNIKLPKEDVVKLLQERSGIPDHESRPHLNNILDYTTGKINKEKAGGVISATDLIKMMRDHDFGSIHLTEDDMDGKVTKDYTKDILDSFAEKFKVGFVESGYPRASNAIAR